jgi:hypothetical protein
LNSALKLSEAASLRTKEIVPGAVEPILPPKSEGSGRDAVNGKPSNWRAMMNSLGSCLYRRSGPRLAATVQPSEQD